MLIFCPPIVRVFFPYETYTSEIYASDELALVESSASPAGRHAPVVARAPLQLPPAAELGFGAGFLAFLRSALAKHVWTSRSFAPATM